MKIFVDLYIKNSTLKKNIFILQVIIVNNLFRKKSRVGKHFYKNN